MSKFETVDELESVLNNIDIEYTYDRYNYNEMSGVVYDQSFETGGVSGGSCWEDSNPSGYSTDLEYSYRNGRLYKLLVEYYPNISFINFNEIISTCVKHERKSENEYYGNCTDYAIYKIDVYALKSFLDKLI